jgi:hypothetical protein
MKSNLFSKKKTRLTCGLTMAGAPSVGHSHLYPYPTQKKKPYPHPSSNRQRWMAPVCKHKKTVIPRGIQPWDFGFNLESAEECFKTFKKKKN